MRERTRADLKRTSQPASVVATADALGLTVQSIETLLMAQHHDLNARALTVGQAEQWAKLDPEALAQRLAAAYVVVAKLKHQGQRAAELPQEQEQEQGRERAAGDRARRPARAVDRDRAAGIAKARAHVQLALPHRRTHMNVVAHLGPTNSGKTFDALQALAASGEGVYAAPLRFLAREVRDRMAAQLGAENVGLLTGEERDNVGAPVLSATAEMAPIHGKLLVLDETHWAADRDRGSAWARLLRFGDYEEMHLIASPDALPLIESAFPHATIVRHGRLGPLRYIGQVKAGRVRPGTAVVAFSRRAVLGLGTSLRRSGHTVAVLYGAMPVDARRRELDRFATGAADVLATTDVIGHGVNVPTLKTVLFAETTKYDGESSRPLERWEVAQIAGRAGRYGMTGEGQVGVLIGYPGLEPHEGTVRRALVPQLPLGHGLRGYRRITSTTLRPRLPELGCPTAGALGWHVEAWRRIAREDIVDRWLEVDDCRTLLAWHARLGPYAGELTVEDAWRLMHIPADPERFADLFDTIAAYVAGQRPRPGLHVNYRAGDLGAYDLSAAEQLAARIAVLRWFAHAFPDRCPFTAQQAAAAEKLAAEQVVALLHANITHGGTLPPASGSDQR